MRANCWMGTKSVEVQRVPDPKILNPRDAIVRITSTAICGSDLASLQRVRPTMKRGDVLGHEFMGEVVELGSAVKNLDDRRSGRRAVSIACGHCLQCEREMYSLCENSNPNAWMAEKMWGYSPCGIFGYSHHARRICRRPGRVRAGSVCRRGPHQGARQPRRRSGPVLIRHLSHRLHGRGSVRNSTRRHHRGVGMWSGRSVRDRERLSAWRRTGHRDRSFRLPDADRTRARRTRKRSTTKTWTSSRC